MSARELGERRIGMVGGGNMAEAMVAGLLRAGLAPAARLRVSEPLEVRRQHLERRYGVGCRTDNAELARWADLLVLAVKPQQAVAAAGELRAGLGGDELVVSLMAGVSTASVERLLGGKGRVVRAMPNAAAMVGAAATALAAGSAATSRDLAVATRLFEAVGSAVVVAEKHLDAVTGLSGSGPAYLMLVIEALADGGVRAGLPRAVALELATQTVYGSARLQQQSGEHPAVIRDRVTSPAGTTAAGLSRLEAAGVRGALSDAVVAAAQRSVQLAQHAE